MYKDGNGATYDPAAAKFTTTPFGMTLPAGKSAAADLVVTPYYTPFDFVSAALFAQKVDNSVAGEMRDCGECHVGGGMMEYVVDPAKTTTAAYDPASRTSLRDYLFNGAITAFNALIDVFNPDPQKRGDVLVQNFAQTGVLEMDCLICHQKDYNWAKRKEAVRSGEYDASRALGANLATRAKDGVTVFYNSSSVTANAQGELTVDLGAKLNGIPGSTQCASCHLGTIEEKYQVDWKKRGEMWTAADQTGKKLPVEVHAGIGCMGCHERTDHSASGIGTSGLAGTPATAKLSLCDPAKGGASPFEALWNQLDGKQFKDCKGCHEPAAPTSYRTFGAPNSEAAHFRAGLSAKIAYDKTGARVSHTDLIDCTACHVRKSGFTGGAFVDGTGADEEGRLALHDSETVAKDMSNGTALTWSNGRLYAANLLTSFFWRDMNGLKTPNGGLDANNDGREAGMDPLLQTHVSNINRNNGLEALSAKGSISADDINIQKTALANDIRAQLGIAGTTQATNAFLPKLSFLMVPFKTSHNIAGADSAWGAKGCKECHSAPGTVVAATDPDNASGAAYTAGGFYNGAYPINGNLEGKFSFDSDQVTAFTKVNGLVDVTDSHPNVVTKKGDRSVPVKLLSKFDTPYVQVKTPGQTLRNIDRSEAIYEDVFQTRDTTWYDASTPLRGGAIAAACNSASPFYCDDPAYIFNAAKKGATSTMGWTLKVEVTDDNGATISTRTKTVGDDMITSVDGIVAALGTAYSDNPDFTVEAVDAATGLAAVSPAANNSLKLTPKGSKKIRISAMSDVGPFGLKGKLWKSDPVVRPSGSYSGRADFVNYLNSITRESAGIAAEPVAVIGDINGQLAGPASIQLVKGQSYALNASSPATYTTYTWDTNAGAAIAPGPSSSVTFTKTGTWRITLTATNADGRSVTKLQKVNVVEPTVITFGQPIPANVTVTVTPKVGTPYEETRLMITVPASVAAGISYNRVRIGWGDGSPTTTVETTALTALPPHQYLRFDKYRTSTGDYRYSTIVQLFNGSIPVASKGVKVVVPQ